MAVSTHESTLGRPKGTASAPDRREAAQIWERTDALEAVPGEPFTLEHFLAWCERYLRQFIDQWMDKPLVFEPWQQEFFAAVFARESVGRPEWKRVVLVLPRKNGKTTMCAALALYCLLVGEGNPEILLAAASDKQAGRMFETVVNLTRKNKALSTAVHLREYIGEISRIDAPGKILRMASDPSTLHGYNPSLVICDELHAWTKPGHRKAWAALTTGGGGRNLSQVVTITTAGAAEERADGLLGRLLDKNEQDGECERSPWLTVSRNERAKAIVFNYSAPTRSPDDLDAMKLANPASWITVEYLGEQAADPELSTSDVLQLHGCVWATGSKAWLPDGAWNMCVAEREVATERVTLGFDGSYNNDSTALVGCMHEERPHLFVIGVWERPPNARDWIVPRDEVIATVKAAMERYDVAELACDPFGWHAEIQEWEDAYGSPPVVVVETNKRALMAEYCSRLYTAVVTKAVTHDGNPRLAAHVANAAVKEVGDLAYISKESRNSPRKIDLAVAAVLAHGRATAEVAGWVGGGW